MVRNDVVFKQLNINIVVIKNIGTFSCWDCLTDFPKKSIVKNFWDVNIF